MKESWGTCYVCDICGAHHPSQIEAHRCERRGAKEVLPHGTVWNEGDLVIEIDSGRQHGHDAYYEVWVSTPDGRRYPSIRKNVVPPNPEE